MKNKIETYHSYHPQEYLDKQVTKRLLYTLSLSRLKESCLMKWVTPRQLV